MGPMAALLSLRRPQVVEMYNAQAIVGQGKKAPANDDY